MATNPIQNRQGPTARQPDRRWDRSTKTIVALAVLLCLALVLYQFRALLRPLLIAFLLAFILNPVIDFLERRPSSTSSSLSTTSAPSLIVR
jgi:predicted PurR-regulated permease PerM